MLNILGVVAVSVVIAFILSKTDPRMPHSRLWRFVLLFALWVPLTVVLNYVNVSLLGFHKMGWIPVTIIALLFATIGTLCPEEPNNANPN
jgi:hypothetical protein